MALRGLTTLHMRMATHAKNAKVFAEYLKKHPAVEKASGFSGMVTFYDAVESLAESPAIMIHASVPEELRKDIGISDSFIHLFVGIEGSPDIIANLDRAFSC
ncbi:cystathionine gamma-lyase [Plasmopara halstedii]|uniref:cystathionine gamma-lyase n=1 Tax=Plasmopara halstedii TaxID=4781 RepID=A0A0P1AIQ5_PLAHL|nr:cystathionine gamma-lyase [Plasmopara halstedii]CEG40702.1 cystathionine gamma-lyase [Plasmopara halstedii]|eukprot:XP_024577071.1 cystathionine gamma-lyase [Plasmopara halstedii]